MSELPDSDRGYWILRKPGKYTLTRRRLVLRYSESICDLLQDQNQSEPCSPFPLFDLPVELRLEVYSYCTAFTLLQLTHTSRQLRYEVRAHPSIVKKAYGYLSLWFVGGGPSRNWGMPTDKDWSWKFGEDQDPLQYDGATLSIRHISILEDCREVQLWNRQSNRHFPEGEPVGTVGYLACGLKAPVEGILATVKLFKPESMKLSETTRLACEICCVVKLPIFFQSAQKGCFRYGNISTICFSCAVQFRYKSKTGPPFFCPRDEDERDFTYSVDGEGRGWPTLVRETRRLIDRLRASYEHGVEDMRWPEDYFYC